MDIQGDGVYALLKTSSDHVFGAIVQYFWMNSASMTIRLRKGYNDGLIFVYTTQGLLRMNSLQPQFILSEDEQSLRNYLDENRDLNDGGVYGPM